jgi:hypothetical protein
MPRFSVSTETQIADASGTPRTLIVQNIGLRDAAISPGNAFFNDSQIRLPVGSPPFRITGDAAMGEWTAVSVGETNFQTTLSVLELDSEASTDPTSDAGILHIGNHVLITPGTAIGTGANAPGNRRKLWRLTAAGAAAFVASARGELVITVDPSSASSARIFFKALGAGAFDLSPSITIAPGGTWRDTQWPEMKIDIPVAGIATVLSVLP